MRGSLFLLASLSTVFAILFLGKSLGSSAVDAPFILGRPFAPVVLPCFR